MARLFNLLLFTICGMLLLLMAGYYWSSNYMLPESDSAVAETDMFCGTIDPFPMRSYVGQHFNHHCRSCHSPDRILVGPALAKQSNRRSAAYLKAFFMNPDSMVRYNDSARHTYEEYGIECIPYFKSEAMMDSMIVAFQEWK